MAKSERKLYTEIFIHFIGTYMKLVYEFILNKNLIDINNEFIIDHINNKALPNSIKNKVIFFFDKKYTIDNWANSFQIRQFTPDETSKMKYPCVPAPLMINDIHFKILETGKTTFLLKNAKIVDF